jgi:light-regulated signal transduction histidine kinase (bacteriophytochrome)
MDQLKRKYENQLDEKALQYIYFATDGAKRMKQIILDLLEYSRAGKETEVLQYVDLNEIIHDYKQLRRKIISEKLVTISTSNLPIINAHKSPLVQIFHALLDNAIKYAKKEVVPMIGIEAVENNSEWVFSISDNGIGIDSKYFDKIFIVFQRLHNRNEYDGNGIGLAIVKKQVEFFGGRIWVESLRNQGSTFYFTLPKFI